jgi:hypothetical protein
MGMTRQQKIILITLGTMNVVVFFCACAALMFGSGGTSNRQALQPTLPRTPTETSTPEPTSTPEATNTLVLRPAATTPARTATPRSLEAGWKFYDASPEGFGMALPSSWQKITLDQDFIASYFQGLKDRNPKFASAFQGVSSQLAASKIKFFAIDASQQAISSNYITSMNALREALPTEMSLDRYVQANITNLSRSGLPNKTPTRKRVTFPAGAAEEIRYQATGLSVVNEKITISVLQYVLVRGRYGYVTTFGTTPDKNNAYAPVFQKMMQSFQWVP